jgi:hypothetical protein
MRPSSCLGMTLSLSIWTMEEHLVALVMTRCPSLLLSIRFVLMLYNYICTPVHIQCCVIRHSTTSMLLSYHSGPVLLSAALNRSLSSDPIKPVLINQHLEAVDRRVGLVLQVVSECLDTAEMAENVVFIRDDLYSNVKPDQPVDDGHYFRREQ